MVSHHVMFSFSTGLNKSIKVPKGKCEEIKAAVEWITKEAGLEVEKYMENPPHWKSYTPAKNIKDNRACELVRDHNAWVQRLYKNIAEWSKNPPKDYEEMTPEFASSIWYGLDTLDIPISRWSKEYYKQEMQELFDIMTGSEDFPTEWGEKKLTPKQAAAVIHLFEEYLDEHDIRLELPKGGDTLLDSDEYFWCENHGAIPHDEAEETKRGKIRCPICKKVML